MSAQEKKTILLVEDQALIAMAQKKTLEKYGYDVVSAASGERAVEIADSVQGIDLILMDINLGTGIDGTEAAVRILASRDLPLIFLSSHIEREVVEKTEGITSYGYIVKNSGETVLLASIKMAFRLFEAKTALRDREEHYRSLFENAGDQVWIEDFSAFKRRVLELRSAGFPDFRSWLSDHPETLYDFADMVRIIDLNRRAMQSIGGEGWEKRHPTLRSFLGTESRGFFAEELSALAEGKLTFETEIRIPGGKGELKAYRLSVDVIPGHEEDLGRVHVVLHDLSGVLRAEAALASKARLQRLLVDLSSPYINLPTENVDSAIETSLGEMARAVGADRAYIFAYDLPGGIGRNTHEWCAPGVEARIHSLQALPLEHIAEAIDLHQRGEPHFIPDVSLLPEGSLRRVLAEQNIKSLLTVPMMSGGRCMGSVGFDSVEKTCSYSENERDVLTIFARILVNIEHRKQTEEKLSKERAELKAVQDNTPVMMCILDADQRVLYANPAFTAFTGISEAELKNGRACGVFGCINALDDAQGCSFGPKCGGCGLNQALTDTYRTGGKHHNVDYRTVFLNKGQRKDVTLLASTARIPGNGRPRILLCLQDVSELRRAENQLRERERYLSAILDTTQDGFWVLDSEGRISDANEAYCRISGYSKEELLNLSILDLDADETPEATKTRIERIIRNGSECFESRHRRKDGSLFDVEISASWLNSDLRGFVCFGRDITERKRTEEQIAALLKEKELLLKETHHRIKNNMHTIHSLLTLQAGGHGDTMEGNVLLDAAGRVQSMMMLYDSLFNSDSTQELGIAAFLPSLIEETIRNFQGEAAIGTIMDIEDIPLNPKILSPIGLIINELVTNSMKYAFKGRSRGTIRFSAEKEGITVRLRYGDDGVGLPESVSLKDSTGFGLRLVGLLTEQIGGTLNVDRKAGTSYTIEFGET